MLKLKITGELCSKSNSRRIVMRGKRPLVIKSEKALLYEESSLLQLSNQLRGFDAYEGYVRLIAHVYYSTKRPDLDISLLQDVLEKAGVYKNDRQVVEIHAFKYWDKENPRVLVEVEEVDI